jgi:hypothetical protein
MNSLSPPPHPHPSRVRAILERARTIYKFERGLFWEEKRLF